MQVFVTGASGFIGSVVVKELVKAGHKVIGLARSDASADTLIKAGVEVLRGRLENLESLKRGASNADGVIHTAFTHDFSKYTEAGLVDKAAIEAMGDALAGSNRPLIVTAGTLNLQAQGDKFTEDDSASTSSLRLSEMTALAQAERGVRALVVRLPPSVHDKGDKAFVSALINIAREKGVSAYMGDGSNRWPAVHRLDAATLFKLALEKGTAGAKYNAIGDEGIPVKEIAQLIGQRLKLPVVSKSPEEAVEHFGWMARFIGHDSLVSSTKTREALGWQPTHIGLIEDMKANYFED